MSHSRLLFSLFTILGLSQLAPSGDAQAQVMTWSHTLHCQAKAVAFNPATHGQIVYAATDDSLGLFKSYDGGLSWQHIQGGANPIDFSAAFVRQFYVMEQDTSVLLAACEYGLHRSTDGGYTWTHPLTQLTFEGKALFEVFDKSLGRPVLYAGQADHTILWRSLDKGATWDAVSVIAGGPNLCTMAAMPGSDSVFVAGSGGGTISRSTDKGLNWTVTFQADSAIDGDVPNLVFDPKNPHRLYATLYQVRKQHFLRSDDAGLTWDTISVPPNTWTVTVSPEDYIWVGRFSAFDHTAPHFLTSTDNGATWNAEPAFDSVVDVWAAHYDPISHTIAVAGAGYSARQGGVFIGRTPSAVTSRSEIHSLQLFPNPTSGPLSLTDITLLPRSTVTVEDDLGRTLRTSEEATSIDLSSLPCGSYWLTVRNGQSIARARVVKQ